uniref:Uncharacterized protein n=1 Tax=Rhizophora mucronata TaxID=61149 RepID=A0A2P2N3P7_RHIMU
MMTLANPLIKASLGTENSILPSVAESLKGAKPM